MDSKPTIADVLKARLTIKPYLSRTPLISYPMLNDLLAAEVYVKREDCQPTSSFKVRGGVNLAVTLSKDERMTGIVGASTGNHGQSLAYAARLVGVQCVICVPELANPAKVAAMRSLGAEVRFHGSMFDDALEYSERLATELGLRYVHSANEPLLIAGVATAALEILEEIPDLDFLFVPLGGGSGAAGACIVTKALQPMTKVIAVQSAQAPAGYESWRSKRLVEMPMTSVAEGLATRSGYELPQQILRDTLDDFLLVTDSEMESAIVQYLESCHVLTEHAGAAALAGALKTREHLSGKKVALILSGANITLSQLRTAMEHGESHISASQ